VIENWNPVPGRGRFSFYVIRGTKVPGLTKKSQKTNFTLVTEPVDRIFGENTDFLVSPNMLVEMWIPSAISRPVRDGM
jgi:hypothetical protein